MWQLQQVAPFYLRSDRAYPFDRIFSSSNTAVGAKRKYLLGKKNRPKNAARLLFFSARQFMRCLDNPKVETRVPFPSLQQLIFVEQYNGLYWLDLFIRKKLSPFSRTVRCFPQRVLHAVYTCDLSGFRTLVDGKAGFDYNMNDGMFSFEFVVTVKCSRSR